MSLWNGTQRPPGPLELIPGHQLNEGCIMFLPFEEAAGDNVRTLARNDIATYSNAAWTWGVGDGGPFRKPVTTGLDIGNNTNFTFTGDVPMSCMIYAKRGSGGDFTYVLSKFNNAFDKREWEVRIWDQGRIQVLYYEFNFAGDEIGLRATVGYWPVSTAKTVIFTYDGSEAVGGIKVYSDGRDRTADFADISDGVYTGMINRAVSMVVGGRDTQHSQSAAVFDADLYNTRIWNRVLRPSEATELTMKP